MSAPVENTPAKLLDVVALRNDKPDVKLVSGQVGTVVAVLPPEVFEVEFCTSKGCTVSLVEVKRGMSGRL